jgi:hypothetical protein
MAIIGIDLATSDPAAELHGAANSFEVRRAKGAA